ncbi:MAG TPA: cobalt ECF transporter T component CbiQ [Phycisphaerales bacterium]|nr:cobalt ECF transporter T component CbiQ [Phycisphaerales bacterium]
MKQSFALFSDYFALMDNRFTRIDSRVKLIVVFAVIAAALIAKNVLFGLSVFVFCVICMLKVRVPVKIIAVRMLPALLIMLVVVIIKALFSAGEVVFEFNLGLLRLTMTREGIAEGLLIGSRVAGALSAVMLLSFVTPAYKIFSALYWLRLPPLWVEIAMSVYRNIFAFLEYTGDIISAQKTRLGYIDTKRSLSSMGTLAGAVLLRAFDQAEKTSQAMKARCYNGTMPFVKPSPLTKGQMRVMLTSIAVIVIVFVLIERPGL